MSTIKRSAALECTLRTMTALGPTYFWTLTTVDEVTDPKEISRRWNSFLTVLRREYKGTDKIRGLRLYEMHPGGHGIHVHFVINRFIHVNVVRRIAQATGWGRIHAVSWDEKRGDIATYLKKYLFKSRDVDWCGTRVYSTFGLKGIATRQSDIEITSPYRTIWQGCAAAFAMFASWPFQVRVDCVKAAHLAWVCGEAADPSEYVAANLVPISTIQTGFDAETACLIAEARQWDRAPHNADRYLRREAWKAANRAYHEAAAARMVAKSKDFA